MPRESWNVGQSWKKSNKNQGEMLTVVRRRGVSGPKFQRFQVVLLRNALLYYLCSPSNHSACCVCCVSLFDPFPDRISHAAAAGLPVFAVAAAAYSRPDFSVSRVMSSAWERDTITSNRSLNVTHSVSTLYTAGPRVLIKLEEEERATIFWMFESRVRDRAERGTKNKRFQGDL